jgi:hypothetical protein
VSNGKGSTPRPLSVDAGTFAANWDRVFGSAGDTGGAALPEGSMPADSRRPTPEPAAYCIDRYALLDLLDEIAQQAGGGNC